MPLGELIDNVAGQHPGRPALLWRDGATTYDALAARARAIAPGLAAIGAGKGARVGILMPNRADWLAVAFAAWKVGAAIVPLNTLWRRTELEHALRHADVTILVAVPSFLDHDYAALLQQIRGNACPSPALPCLRHVIWADRGLAPLIAAGEALPRSWLEAAQSMVSDTDIAAIFFTSGTTAVPKAVIHTHASVLQAANNVADCLGLTAADRTWGYLPFFFTGGLVAVALGTMSRGGAVLLQEVFDPGEALELMIEHGCTTLFAWPHQAEALIAHPAFDRARLRLRKGVGANTAWAERLYPPDHEAVGTWGMTETGPMATASRHDDPPAVRAGSHGRPAPGVELRVIDPRSGAELGAGEEGELLVRGATLMLQYYKIPRAECFDAHGFFHTGDLARIDGNGLVHFAGRLKEVIKTAGASVAAAEVEAVLLQHPAVKAAYAVGVPHPTRGENVAAFAVADAGAGELLEWCRSRLASYKVPRHLWLISESDLPTLGSGKVDKAGLRRIAVAWASGGR